MRPGRARRCAGGGRGTSPTTRPSSARSERQARRPPTLAPAVYAQLVPRRQPRWMPPPALTSSCSAMAGPTVASPRRSTVQEMVAALPDAVACASGCGPSTTTRRSGEPEARPGRRAGGRRSTRGRARRGAHICVTETGVGGDNPGAAAGDRRRVAARPVPRAGRRATPVGRRSARRCGVPVHVPGGQGLPRRPRRRRPHPGLPDL